MPENILHKKFYNKLKEARKILLVAHKKPDGDTLGAIGAFLHYLKREGKEVTAFCVDEIPDHYHYMCRSHKMSIDPAIFENEYDLLCVFDSSDLKYAGVEHLVAKMPSRPHLVVIDHHSTNVGYGNLNVVFVDASSTAEIAYQFFRANNIFIDPDMATCMLTGILSDTSHFTNPATNSISLEGASHLLLCGGRLNDITRYLVHNKTVPGLQLWGRALERIKENKKEMMASTVIREQDLIEVGTDSNEAIEGLSNFLGAVLDVPIIMVLTEKPGGIVKGSLRSATEDVSKIAKSFGGGGHKKAAGFEIAGKVVEKKGIWQVEPTLDLKASSGKVIIS